MADAEPESAGGEWAWNSVVEERPPVDLKIDQPHPARIYNYLLGGKDNFPADREAAERTMAASPSAAITARQNRAFMARMVRYLAGEAGIRQFLDIGTGIPTSPNLHEVAQAVAPEARVVYADNDPIVLAHARALLTSGSEGRTAYLDVDLREVERILGSRELRDTLDLTQPVALSLLSILHFVPDEDDPAGLIRRILDALPSGSYLAISHATADFDPGGHALAEAYRRRGIALRLRDRAEVESLFAGVELVDPGVVVVTRWRPDGDVPTDLTDAAVSVYGGIARKP